MNFILGHSDMDAFRQFDAQIISDGHSFFACVQYVHLNFRCLVHLTCNTDTYQYRLSAIRTNLFCVVLFYIFGRGCHSHNVLIFTEMFWGWATRVSHRSLPLSSNYFCFSLSFLKLFVFFFCMLEILLGRLAFVKCSFSLKYAYNRIFCLKS